MKLLHDFFRLRLAGLRAASVRGAAVSREFSVTVPAPLAKPAGGGVERIAAAPVRREPASFLKAPRHRRLGSGR
ncbi:hypothetical protein [Rhodanobacter soli]|jgi:hypothetical protein|nr:MAG: hypothetical protein A2211_02950 [Rhodanobacter sp. RIFOXYA1_FULL_67_6]